jgi:chromosomal replication initiation ATPase DnaA
MATKTTNQPKLQFYALQDRLNNFYHKNLIVNQENKQAADGLKIFLESNFSSLFSNIFIVTGPKNCGKSHLAVFTLAKLGYEFELINNKSIEKKIEQNLIYLFDNYNFEENENSLLEFINFASENKCKIIITTRKIAKISLNDLKSRIKNANKSKINEPSPAFAEEIFYNEASYLQVRIDKKIVDKIMQENYRRKNLVEILMTQIKL